MKNFIKIAIVALLITGCQAEPIENTSSLTIPQRFHGTFKGTATDYTAIIKGHSIEVITPEETFKRTEGETQEDNGTTLFRAKLKSEETLILLYNKDCCIGISLFDSKGKTIIKNDYYNL